MRITASVEETLEQSTGTRVTNMAAAVQAGASLPRTLERPASAASRTPLTSALALVRACRPKQWTKNLLLLAAPAAAGVLGHADVAGRVALGFAAFCLLSSCTYLLNDVHDREEDAHHPRKRARPIASGEVSVPLLLLGVAGLGLAALATPALAAMGAGYLALTGAYTLWWRSIAVADIAGVAAGFVIRALAGGVAAGVPDSRWFVIVASFGALFIVTGKRYAELYGGSGLAARDVSTESPGNVAPGTRSMRASLQNYSAGYLQFVMILAAAVAVGAYCLWAFQRRADGTSLWYDFTIVPFVLWLMRYALLVDQGQGEAPEEMVLGDRFLLAMSVVWVMTFAGAVYVG
jgi:decaprenyl-phosphate phosphoribosyltransferase